MPTILERLKTLAAIDAISGQEAPLVAFLRDALTPLCDEVAVDAVGNLYAIRRGAADGPTVMVAAHTDEIGMVVKSVDERGFIRFEKVGGVIDGTLAARLVRVAGHLGVIGMKAGHYQSVDERARVLPHTRMYIDIGADSAERVADLGIEIGDPITFVSDVVEFGHGAPLVAGKAIDDRLGCAVLWSVLEAGPPPAGTFLAAFTSQEEVGLKGAGVAGTRIAPQLALALDTMPSGDTPDMDAGTDLNVSIGSGPALQVLAGAGGKGFLVNQSVKRYLQSTAARAGVPLQLTAFTGGNNDAATIAWSGLGVPAASICLPRRYSHSPTEVADLRDADAAFRLLRAVVDDMDALPTFSFLDEGATR
ncbi:MAG: M20/M25/M40 family metallo-hydrolase [Trueperaceae bacterium]|nr:M20/M25/M40 family metallo-hydrolase [Trueperaceae bacterium]